MKSKAWRILLGVVVFAGVLALVGWQLPKPKVSLASLAEIEAVLPRETLVKPAANPESQARLERLEELLRRLIPTDLVYTPEPWYSAKKAIFDRTTWTSGQVAQIELIADSGPGQLPDGHVNPRTRVLVSNANAILVSSAAQLAASHHLDAASHCLVVAEKVASFFLAAGGPILDYQSGLSMEFNSDKAIAKLALNGSLTTLDCSSLLKAVPPATISDPWLAQAERSQFQREILPCILNPVRHRIDREAIYWRSNNVLPMQELSVASYDAVATAKLAGQVLSGELANTKRPLSEFDVKPMLLGQAANSQLMAPPQPGMDSGFATAWDEFYFRIGAANADNYVGLMLISTWFGDDDLLESSIKVRAQRNALRVLLASRLYRASHKGDMPATQDGLLPYLGAWPIDVKSGAPMQYEGATTPLQTSDPL